MAAETDGLQGGRRRPSWRESLTDPAVGEVALYASLIVLGLVVAYFTIFSQFQPYDDEGTLLVTLKAFVHGETLYRDVYSPYGPFYYEVFGGLFSLFGLDVTTDASRWITILVWILASLAFGRTVQRLSGRVLLGAGAMIVAFSTLGVLINEPMHPHGLSILMISIFGLLAAVGPGRSGVWRGALAGALLGALVMTKVNLGGFAVAAALLAAVLAVEPLSRRGWLRWLAAAAFLLMPLVVMQRDLSGEDVRNMLLVELLAMTALLIVAWRPRPVPTADDRRTVKWLAAAAAGLVAAMVAIVIVIVLAGTSLGDLYDGAVREALRVRDVLKLILPVSQVSVDWAIASVAVAILTVRLRPWASGRPSLWPALLRVLAGLVIWYSITGIGPIGLHPSADNRLVLPIVLAWVAVVAPAGGPEPSWKRFLRVLFPAMALGEALQVYPVAGSQVGIAAVTFVPVGGLCIADGLTGLRAWADDGGQLARQRFAAVVPVVTVAIVVQLGVAVLLLPAVGSMQAYRRQKPLDLPGAGQLHLPEANAQVYEELVGLLHQNGCTDFIGYPNVDSLYLWSGIDPPPPAAPGAWIRALDREQQQRIVDELKASSRPCVVRSKSQAELWLHGSPPPDLPLVRYILNDFTTVAEVGEFEIALPRNAA